MKKFALISLLIIVVLIIAVVASRQYGQYAYDTGYDDGAKGMARAGWPNKYLWMSAYERGQVDAANKRPKTR